MLLDRRRAGVLLHPTSLPGRYGIGDLGPECLRFLDWMRDAGLAYWQVLPLGPTSFGDSPYQCFSAFAGNPMLVSPEMLVIDGLARQEDVAPPSIPNARVDYGAVINYKTALLRYVFERFQKAKDHPLAPRFAAWKKAKTTKLWLEDYAAFRVCKDLHEGRSWCEWDSKLRTRNPQAMEKLAKDQAANLEFHAFAQFLFFHQWERVRQAAKDRGIAVIGDAPIYVAYDSADTWANQELFQLDKKGLPKAVAGVPPDYFSKTGQLWGNPLYDWAALKETKYAWWLARMEVLFETVDVVRLDHFRGFMGYWSVPAGEKTAVNGKWVKGPGADFFAALKRKFKDLPIIAEDLGEITPDVVEVRDAYNLPGMKIMQFAWGVAHPDPLIPDPGHNFHLHNHVPNCVVYTGTHDNDTTMGWWKSATALEQHHLRSYLWTNAASPHLEMIRTAFMSCAHTAIVPMQDILGLGSEARMNFPSKADGNWAWRMSGNQLDWEEARKLRNMLLLFQRCNNPPAVALPKADAKAAGVPA